MGVLVLWESLLTPHQRLPVYALLLTAYSFALCSTDLHRSVLEFLKQK